MSIFGTILSKVFGNKAAEASSPGAQHAPDAALPTAPASPAPPPGEADHGAGASGEASSAAPAPQPGSGQSVDVAKVLDGMASHAGQKLDWRHSIVDLMKLLGMDSSFASRKELAHELHYTGDTNDSASMNIWLHKQVMTKFAEHGGHLPPELKH